MTRFQQVCCPCLLLLSLALVAPTFAAEPLLYATATVQQLQQENTALQGKVQRLEHQVAALRQELNAPDATQTIGGIGYIVGLFGIAGWFTAHKKNRQEK
jgi:hypothetical protein